MLRLGPDPSRPNGTPYSFRNECSWNVPWDSIGGKLRVLAFERERGKQGQSTSVNYINTTISRVTDPALQGLFIQFD